MRKLISKHSEGGTSSLTDKILGISERATLEFLDPTGITSWKGAKQSYTDYKNNPTLANLAALGMASLAVIPVIGTAGKIGKLGKLGKEAHAATEASKVAKASRVARAIPSKNFIDADLYKAIIDPNNPSIEKIGAVLSKKQLAEVDRILTQEIQKVYDWCKSKNLRAVPPKLQDKIAKLEQKKETLRFVDANPETEVLRSVEFKVKEATENAARFGMDTPKGQYFYRKATGLQQYKATLEKRIQESIEAVKAIL